MVLHATAVQGSFLYRAFYMVLFLNCRDQAADITLEYDFMNPGGEYLSTGQIPIKTLSEAALFTFIALTVVYTCHVFYWIKVRACSAIVS